MSGDYVPVRVLAPFLHQDIAIAVNVSGMVERFAAVAAAPAAWSFKSSSTPLRGNADRGGNPAPVVEAMRRFFT